MMNEPFLLPKDLLDLQEAMMDLPDKWRRYLMPSVDQLTDGIMRRKRILKIIQENISELDSQVKYLIFDLKCTRQERDEARI